MRATTKKIEIDSAQPARESLLKAARAVLSGGLVVFPTSGIYGLGGDAMRPEVAQRIFAIKKRPPDKPILVLVKDRKMAESITWKIPDMAYRIMDAFWPGGVTLVMKADESLPGILTAGTGRIGVRLPRHPVAAALMEQLNCPLTGTSANTSGLPGCSRIAELDLAVADGVDCILDAGPLRGGSGSTIVDVTGSQPVILREGVVSAVEIYRALNG